MFLFYFHTARLGPTATSKIWTLVYASLIKSLKEFAVGLKWSHVDTRAKRWKGLLSQDSRCEDLSRASRFASLSRRVHTRDHFTRDELMVETNEKRRSLRTAAAGLFSSFRFHNSSLGRWASLISFSSLRVCVKEKEIKPSGSLVFGSLFPLSSQKRGDRKKEESGVSVSESFVTRGAV